MQNLSSDELSGTKLAETAVSSYNASDSFNLKSCQDAVCEMEKNLETTDSDEEYSDANCESEEELELDEESMKERHKDLSETELQKSKEKALDLKNEGNECFKNSNYKGAIACYTRALNVCPLKYELDRSILFANRAAAKMSTLKEDEAILDCNKAIELNPNYLKAILRRAQLHKKKDNLDKCLEDYQKVLELDRNNAEARQACATLPAEIEERNEKLKTEMFGKLKELGNLCLRPFGLSTENFKVVQDPNSGGYSINFQNNGS